MRDPPAILRNLQKIRKIPLLLKLLETGRLLVSQYFSVSQDIHDAICKYKKNVNIPNVSFFVVRQLEVITLQSVCFCMEKHAAPHLSRIYLYVNKDCAT